LGRWLLYGANGYTGRLIAEHAVHRGVEPVLAGRRADAIVPLARRLGLEHRVFDLGDPRALDLAMAATGTILLAAGPFSGTSLPVLDACLRTRSAYLNITSEVAVFEAVMARNAEAQKVGSGLLPGVGFDVVPPDCLAARLHAALPTATHLELAIHGGGRPSRGTLLTMLDGLRHGGAVRVNGSILREPLLRAYGTCASTIASAWPRPSHGATFRPRSTRLASATSSSTVRSGGCRSCGRSCRSLAFVRFGASCAR
jgi:short subunit dehydrogenase-like uncharacterized protein